MIQTFPSGHINNGPLIPEPIDCPRAALDVETGHCVNLDLAAI